MPDQKKPVSAPVQAPAPGTENRPSVSARFEQFEKRQRELWRFTFAVLFVLAIFFAWTSWAAIRDFAHRYEALPPILLVVIVALFGAYMWGKTKEVSELRGLMRGIEQRDATPPSDRQLEQLFDVISKSQQGFRDLIDSFDDVLLALSLEGEVRAVNRSFSDLLGLAFSEIIGKPIGNFLAEASGDESELLSRAMPRFLDRRHWSGVLQVRLKGRNSVYYFDCVAHAMVRDNQVNGITILGRDITALRKNEARFTELFETLQEGIYISTPEGAILDANPALVRILGYASKEELLAKTVPEIFIDRNERKSIKEQVEREPMLEGREITLLRKDGAKIICLNTAAAVRDVSGKVVRYQGAVMDITQRREMEKRLHQQQEFARRLVDSFPDLILVLDASAQYTFVSPRCTEVLGYDLEETRSMKLGGRTHPEDLPAILALFDEIMSGKQSFASLEVRVRHKQGDWRRIRFNFSPLFDETGKIDGVVLSGRDVTDLKRLEEQLIQAEKLAAMGQMLAGVAHELNNPLTAVLGVTELLRERSGVDESTKRQLELTHRQARRAARIVQNLLEFSRPASPQKKPLDLNSLVERTIQLHEHSLRRNNIAVDFHPQHGIPGVIGDGNQLIQVFLNLITNAEQAIREVRDNGRIQIRIARNGNRVSLTIQDDGPGIRVDALPRIFDPFYTTKRPGGGTGLGLSICMSIVREHGGSIEADVLPAGGAAFTVFLPAAIEEPASGTPSAAEKFPSSVVQPASDVWKDRSILVLDDEESIRTLIAEGLRAQGMIVDCAGTAEEALAFVARRSYDVLLCDLNLAGGGEVANGEEAAARILTASSKKPTVVYMSGDLVSPKEDSENPGAPRRLQKPFRILDVLTLLKDILSAIPAETQTR